MPTYAQIRNGVVLAHFTTDRPASDFSDIQHELYEAPADVQDGWVLREDGSIGPEIPSAEQIAADYTARLEALYDAKAQERRYDTRFTCALRAGYVGPFQADGVAFAQWMDASNAHGYTVMAAVQAGDRPLPTWEELAAELPAAPW